MDTNINISTINKYFSRNKEKQTSNIRTKIVNYSHFSINEANICHKISKIPYYSNFFTILDDHEALNISQLNENILEKLNPTEDMKYYLFKYSDKNSDDFIDFIYNSKSIKKLIFDIINSFQHILYGLHILNDANICFFNLSPKNIDYTYISHILNKLEDFTFQPFEIHILYFFVHHHMVTISHSFIDDFCENFVENLNVLRLYSENYKKAYKEQCIETMKKYVNLQRKEIIDDILERNDKWDVYGVSMIYLQIFGCISRVFSLKGTFISKITLELSKNLHPNSDRRMTLEETLNIFNKYLNEENNWDFVNKLDNSKLEELFNDFAK